ncbi:hypothetical protein [Saccharopolyspora mangrovi]|uniref:hypothetical protein n=1 Tax=Saccharopolyspora mangrovi TaxID=3082379 RepID=UPI00389A5A28
MPLIVTALVVAAVMRVSLDSATVAITTASVCSALRAPARATTHSGQSRSYWSWPTDVECCRMSTTSASGSSGDYWG